MNRIPNRSFGGRPACLRILVVFMLLGTFAQPCWATDHGDDHPSVFQRVKRFFGIAPKEGPLGERNLLQKIDVEDNEDASREARVLLAKFLAGINYGGFPDRGSARNAITANGTSSVLLRVDTPPSQRQQGTLVEGGWERSVVGIRDARTMTLVAEMQMQCDYTLAPFNPIRCHTRGLTLK